MDRVKSWFGFGHHLAGGADPPAGKRHALSPVDGGPALAFAGAAAPAVGAASAPPDGLADDGADEAMPPMLAAAPRLGSATPAAPAASSRLDPLDPAWVDALANLPRRLTASAAAADAAGTAALRRAADELAGHRSNTEAIRDAVRRLPAIADRHAGLTQDTNKILTRQCLLLESMFDGITDLRASFRTVEESSRRHLVALAQLEQTHRQVLHEYQVILLKAHRRLGRVAALAIVLALASLGGMGYMLWRLMGAP